MSQLLTIKAKLEQDLLTINEALKIEAKHLGENGSGAYPVADITTIADRRAHLSTEDIEKAILKIEGHFSSKDVPLALNKAFAEKVYFNPSAIHTCLSKLTKEGKLEVIRHRRGRIPAIYCVKIAVKS